MVQNNEDAADRPRPIRPAPVPQKPAAARPPSSASAPQPAPRPAPKPLAKPVAPAAGSTAKGVAKPAVPSKAPSKVAPTKARPRAQGEDDDGEERPHHHLVIDKGLDPITKYGMIGAGGLAVIVLIVVMIVMGKKGEIQKAQEDYENKVAAVHQKLVALDTKQEGDPSEVIASTESQRKLWSDHEKARDIELLLSRAKAKVESSKEQRETMSRFTDVEKKLEDVSNMTPEQVKDLRRQLEELEVKLTSMGPEMLARYSKARGSADRSYATRLLDDAKKYAAANPDDNRLALVRFTGAEDGLKELVDRAFLDKNKELQDFYTPLYKEAIAEADRLVTALFSGPAADKLPVIDCLAGTKVGEWNASAAKGFSHRVDKGELQLTGPDADAGKNAVISIGDREQWRSFVADVEFTVENGSVDMYYRLGKAPNANTPMYTLRSEGASANLRAGQKYRARMSIVGSHLTVKYADDQANPPDAYEEDLSWVKSRKGAIGFLIPPGARLKFSKFQVRELR